ncbi:T9SS type A sorting domain-containing protein [Candidatus Neomarinimicrobiota bacterium]
MKRKYQTKKGSRRVAQLGTTVLRRPVILVLYILSLATTTINAQSGNAIIRLISDNGPLLTLNDTATFSIQIDTGGDHIFGAEAYVSIPNTILTPVLSGPDSPFIPGTWIKNGAQSNNTWTDSLGYDTNGIPGVQYNYSQIDLDRKYNGVGTLAQFRVVPNSIPDNPTATVTLSFDMTNFNGRLTKYLIETEFGTPEAAEFSQTLSVTVQIGGAEIRPAIPDTNITPGASYIIDLANHFMSGAYDVTDPGVTWSWTSITPVADVNVLSDFPNDQIAITTGATAYGTLEFDLFMDAVGAVEGDFSDSQRVTITVNSPPAFDQDLTPANFTFDEDTPFTRATSTLFTDLDDNGPNITMWLEPDSLVHLTYDNNDNFTVSTDQDWFGTQSARLFVRDGLGITADTLLSFVVNAVNDTPVIDLSYIGSVALGDTLIIHHLDPVDPINLYEYTVDVDDLPASVSFTHSFDNTNLNADLVGSVLSISTKNDGFFGNIPIIISALDDDGATGKDTLIVSIRSWPPEFEDLTPIAVLSGTDKVVELDLLITDRDTDLADLIWSFQIVDFLTGLQDDSATLNYDQPTQILTLNTLNGDTTYSALDLLYLAVLDDNDNWAYDTVTVGFFSDLNPMLIPFPRDTVLTSSVDTLFNLASYVIYPTNNPEDIGWSYSGGDSLANVEIDNATENIIVTTDAVFFGPDTISITAQYTNDNITYSTSQDLIVHVIPESDGPPRWSPMPTGQTVYPNTDTLFDIRSLVKDDFTEDDNLVFTMFVEANPLISANLDTISSYLVTVAATSANTGRVWIYFTADDQSGFSAKSDTVWVDVKDSYAPIWETIPTYRFISTSFATDTLSKYLSDKDTPFSDLQVQIFLRSGEISVSYDTLTSIFIITSTASEPHRTYLTFYVTDDVGNTATIDADVIVDVIILYDEPDGEIAYYFNPVANNRIFYSVVADSTVNRQPVYKDNVWYFLNGKERTIEFFQEDSLPGVQRWTAPEEFRADGTYDLRVDMISKTRPPLELRLRLDVSLAKSTGGRLVSPDKRLSATYSAGSVSDAGLVLLSEQKIPENLQQQIDGLHKGNGAGDESSRLYALDANLAEPVQLDLAYKSDHTDAYYAFYEVVNDQLKPIETFIDRNGTFTAATKTGRDILFAAAATAAGEAPLPEGYLLASPNPFNATVTMTIALKGADVGQLRIYNLLGREIYSTGNRELAAGTNSFQWHAVNDHGITVPSGIYFVRLETNSGLTVLKKVTLLK